MSADLKSANLEQQTRYRALLGELASLYPQLSPSLQTQAKQANDHVSLLVKQGHIEQAIELLAHMRDMSLQLLYQGELLPSAYGKLPGKDLSPRSDSPASILANRQIPNGVSIPPPTTMGATGGFAVDPRLDSTLRSIKSTINNLQDKVTEGAALSAMSRQVRDIELDNKIESMERQVREMRVLIGSQLANVRHLISQVESTLTDELKKSSRSLNPFCSHESHENCEYCAGAQNAV